MNNLRTYKQYLNEKWWFNSTNNDDDIVSNLIKKLKNNIDINNLKYKYKYNRYPSSEQTDESDIISYTYILKKDKKKNVLDPYDEEDWGDDNKNREIIILIRKRVDDEEKQLLINGTDLDISNKCFNKMWEFLSNAEKDNEERIKREKKLAQDRLRKEKVMKVRDDLRDLLG